MSSGVPTNRTNIDLPASVSDAILQKVQESSKVMRLARQMPLPGNGAAILFLSQCCTYSILISFH